MSDPVRETIAERRAIGAVWLTAMTTALVVAVIVQPLAEWGAFGYLLGAVGVMLALAGLWLLVTGRGSVLSPRYGRTTQIIISAAGLAAATLLVILTLVTDWGDWTAVDALTVGAWVSIGTMFALSLTVLLRSRRR